MCFKTIKNLFRKPKVLPHPEEPENPEQTIDNVDIDAVFADWYAAYQVPEQWRDHWRNAIVITVKLDTPVVNGKHVPAGTYWDSEGKRHLDVRPEWLNPGVIAHEQAHNSYALLTEDQKTAFEQVYVPLKSTDPLIKLLYSKNTYGLTSTIEGHAEVYRYLSGEIPEALKQYYPRLME